MLAHCYLVLAINVNGYNNNNKKILYYGCILTYLRISQFWSFG